VIKCRDGSGRFTRDRLNDDFCDCPDGTDEPGNPSFPLRGSSTKFDITGILVVNLSWPVRRRFKLLKRFEDR
jgi:hypothetical protein